MSENSNQAQAQAHVYTVEEVHEYDDSAQWTEWYVKRDGIVIARCDEHLAAQHIAGLFNMEEQLIAAYNATIASQKAILRGLGYPVDVIASRYPTSLSQGGNDSGA